MSPPNPSPPKCPLVPRLNPKGLSNIWNRETSQHMPPCPPLNPSPPKSPLVPRLNPKGLSNIFKLLLFRGECDPFWCRGECDPLLGANVTPVPVVFVSSKIRWWSEMVCLKLGYAPDYGYIIGKMMINHQISGVLFSDETIIYEGKCRILLMNMSYS